MIDLKQYQHSEQGNPGGRPYLSRRIPAASARYGLHCAQLTPRDLALTASCCHQSAWRPPFALFEVLELAGPQAVPGPTNVPATLLPALKRASVAAAVVLIFFQTEHFGAASDCREPVFPLLFRHNLAVSRFAKH